jgi:hypothetical protein
MDSDALKKPAQAVINTKETAMTSLSNRIAVSRLKGALNFSNLLLAGVV